MRFDEVIGAPLDGFECVAQLARVYNLLPVFNDAPRQHRDGEGHREAELDVVPCIVVASHQVHLRMINQTWHSLVKGNPDQCHTDAVFVSLPLVRGHR